MTDQELWGKFCDGEYSQVVASYLKSHEPTKLFLAALAIGREEGRKERTVEIAEKFKYIPTGYGDFLPQDLELAYPECFGEGDEK